MRIFLTGVSGYLGRVLVDHLARMREVECITGISRSAPDMPLPENVQFQSMDVRSPDLKKIMAGHDVVIHSAFIVLWPRRMPAAVRDDINLGGTRNVVQSAVSNRVRHFIEISSTSAYDQSYVRNRMGITEDAPLCKGDSCSYYSNNKGLAEKMETEILGASGICLTIFRPIYVVGPRNTETIPSYRQSLIKIPGKDPYLQYIHEDDVADAFCQAIQTEMPGVYNVVPDDAIRLSEVAEIVDKKFLPVVPIWLARWMTTLRWRYFQSIVHSSWVDVTYNNCTYSNARLRATGWHPRYNSREALSSAVHE